MCMSNVDFTFEEGKDYGIGYRKYRHVGGRILGQVKNWDECSKTIRMKRWHKADAKNVCGQKAISSTYGREYAIGFHIFNNEQDAANYNSGKYGFVVVKVRYRNVVAFGSNNILNASPVHNCVIAREIYLDEIITKDGKPVTK